ncbi:beta-ketoacyl-ACP synthase [Niveibacterium terrae]|uniref:beta-ketoacyl-ACP synthase n=1 Tax=Niveibacterium terrae TaxID=3373598 RepID=UPI003A94EB6B
MKRVVVTGFGSLSPLGHDWDSVSASLKSLRNVIRKMPEWAQYEGLNTRLGAPVAPFALPAHYNRKTMRSMGRNAVMAVRAAELALEDSGLLGDPLLRSGRMGVSCGSSAGSTKSMCDFGNMINNKTVEGINATTYIKMMSHTAPVNIAVFFGMTGRVIPTSSACTSGSQGIGYAFEAIRSGAQVAMIAGGSEELCPTEAAVFDTLFATCLQNDTPELVPRPFDAKRDGLVLGEGAGMLVLEEYEHAKARGATIHAELVGFGTNCDGTHVTHPNALTMAGAMRLALEQSGLAASAIGYVNGHGTATEQGDIAESEATASIFGRAVPFSTLKSYMGHTLGACGALEAWMSIRMMNEGWFAPTLNLTEIDPRCGDLDYLRDAIRAVDTEHVMSNNFAFGGINTSLIFRRL